MRYEKTIRAFNVKNAFSNKEECLRVFIIVDKVSQSSSVLRRSLRSSPCKEAMRKFLQKNPLYL